MKYKRILLISPKLYVGRPKISIHPLAGLGYIAESLKNYEFDIDVFDRNLHHKFSDLIRKIFQFNPDIIGFTLMTFSYRDVYQTIKCIKKLYPDVKIAVGGPHLSMLREQVLQECAEIDYGIILEGDYSFVALCRGEDLNNIQGLIFRKDGRVIKNDFKAFITDLDKLPFPRYEKFELAKYPARQIGIVTSRGCPYNCIYCQVISAIGKQFRQRSAQSIVDEIGYWYYRGYRDILILDDNFTSSRRKIEEICDLLGRKDFKGLHLKCPNGIRADQVDYNLLKQMKTVGFNMIAFGVEAATDKVLQNIKKGEDIETIEARISDACKLGFDVQLFFLIGSPGENFEDVKSSFNLALRYPVKGAKFFNIIPFPTTELYDWIEKNGYFSRSPEDIMNNATHFRNEPSFYTPEMSVQDRKRAFIMGAKVTRQIRRRFIETKINAPLIIKKGFSWIYTQPSVERILINSPVFVMAKKALKVFLKESDKTEKVL